MESLVKAKSKRFAIRIINLYRLLTESRGEYVLSKQILRSGTSIGANVTEALCGASRKDFLAKMYIAYKECAETEYWLELLLETGYIGSNESKSIMSDCTELKKMLTSITNTTKKSLKPTSNS